MTAQQTLREPGLIVPLAAAENVEGGGKAAGLARLIQFGIPVPAGWVLTMRADRLRRSGQLADDVLDSLVRDRLLGARYAADCTFAVRSSADAEDSAKASFAGQFSTELNVRRDEVPAAVRRVAASVASPSAKTYARRLGVPAPDSMAVLVQEQLESVLSGVCFTAHPVTGANAMILEYACGPGHTGASGGALAGTFVLPQLPGHELDAQQLSAAGPFAARWLREVALLAARLDVLLGCPQDVEWAVDAAGLWVTQVRPITTIRLSPVSRASMRGTSWS